MNIKIKKRSHRYDINCFRSKHGQKYIKWEKCLSVMMLTCIRQYLSNIYEKALLIKNHVFTYLTCLRARMFWVLSWSRAWRTCVLDVPVCLCARVLGVLVCLYASVLDVLGVLASWAILLSYALMCSYVLHDCCPQISYVPTCLHASCPCLSYLLYI